MKNLVLIILILILIYRMNKKETFDFTNAATEIVTLTDNYLTYSPEKRIT